MVNKKAFDGLPANLQNIIKVACAAENNVMAAEYHANNIHALYLMKHQHKVDIRPYPDDLLNAYFKVSQEVAALVAQESPIAKRIYESYSSYRGASIQMSKVTEQGFLNARALAANL
jgi:TRAP-type mannitol/chloroaromatic compound transport system substrate-binding protein